MADDDVKKAFVDAQMRLQDLTRQLQSCKSQAFQRDREARMGDVTVAELEALRQAEPELVTYKAVGKMFLMEDPKAITTDLAAKSEKFKREVNVLIKTKDYLETAVKEQENAIRELFVTRRA